jgi:hypothetical protein
VYYTKYQTKEGDFTVLLLDEPTDSVNSSVGPLLFSHLNNLKFAQVVCSSHNLQVINAAFESLVTFDTENPTRLETTSTAKRGLVKNVYGIAQKGLSLLDVIKLESFHRVILIEGPTDKKFLKAITSTRLWDKLETQVVFVEAPAKEFVNKLKQYFKTKDDLHGHSMDKNVKVLYINDRDYHHMSYFEKIHSSIKDSIEQYKWLSVESFIWEKNEFENYLLVDTILDKIAGWEGAYKELEDRFKYMVPEKLLRGFASEVLHDTKIADDYNEAASDISGFIDAKIILYGIHEFSKLPKFEEEQDENKREKKIQQKRKNTVEYIVSITRTQDNVNTRIKKGKDSIRTQDNTNASKKKGKDRCIDQKALDEVVSLVCKEIKKEGWHGDVLRLRNKLQKFVE